MAQAGQALWAVIRRRMIAPSVVSAWVTSTLGATFLLRLGGGRDVSVVDLLEVVPDLPG
ncbi:hypothetical protein ACFV19_11700 [Streptomyces griseoluteus]|uniref:hypothetical protein n=1 Tax=Streptomyces griseoluteus TaxID=29306 RepID=UPI0036CC41E7